MDGDGGGGDSGPLTGGGTPGGTGRDSTWDGVPIATEESSEQSLLRSMGYTDSDPETDGEDRDSTESMISKLKRAIVTAVAVFAGLAILYFALHPFLKGILGLFGIQI
ncbi:MAG: hypothetical protein ABEI57_03695 [Halapricum sp.]